MGCVKMIRFPILGLVLASVLPIEAKLVAVYFHPDSLPSAAELSRLVAAARENPHVAPSLNVEIRVAEEANLTSEFSVPSGRSAYFWSDHAFRYEGFKMSGVYARYEREAAVVASEPVAVHDGPTSGTSWATDFLDASWTSTGTLTLRYSLAGPGRLSIKAHESTGRSVGRWEWSESGTGHFSRILSMVPRPSGPLFVTWEFEGVRVVRKVGPAVYDSR